MTTQPNIAWNSIDGTARGMQVGRFGGQIFERDVAANGNVSKARPSTEARLVQRIAATERRYAEERQETVA